MARRSRAREVTLQLLFQADQNPTPVPRAAIEQFARDRLLEDPEMTAYCLALYDGTLAHQAEIDPILTATATNWRLSRMHPADRNVLRIATYELLFDPTAQPTEVVINEAIELARRFGSADSAKFINGVLDKVARTKTPGSAAEPLACRHPAPDDPTCPTAPQQPDRGSVDSSASPAD
jgi:N utilization substance protein B